MSVTIVDFVCKRVEIRGAGLLVVKSDGTLESDKQLRVDAKSDALVIYVGLIAVDGEPKRKTPGLKNVLIGGSIVSGGSIHIGDIIDDRRASRVAPSMTSQTYRIDFKSNLQELIAYGTQTPDVCDKINADALRVMWYADHIARDRLDIVSYGSLIELRVPYSVETLTATATRANIFLATSVDQCRAKRAFLTACDNSMITRVTCGELHYIAIDSAVIVKVETSVGHTNQRGSERSFITK